MPAANTEALKKTRDLCKRIEKLLELRRAAVHQSVSTRPASKLWRLGELYPGFSYIRASARPHAHASALGHMCAHMHAQACAGPKLAQQAGEPVTYARTLAKSIQSVQAATTLLANFGLHSFGLYDHGLCSHGLYGHGLYSHGLYSCGD